MQPVCEMKSKKSHIHELSYFSLHSRLFVSNRVIVHDNILKLVNLVYLNQDQWLFIDEINRRRLQAFIVKIIMFSTVDGSQTKNITVFRNVDSVYGICK